jgi:hypothetical protein
MTGWQFLHQKIVSYLNHYMSALLTGQQQPLFALEKHLQIYVSTTDKGFHKVLHAWSYKRTFMELYKYIKQEYHPSNAFKIRMSSAFLPCLSVHWFDPKDKDKILQDVSRDCWYGRYHNTFLHQIGYLDCDLLILDSKMFTLRHGGLL